MIITGIEKHEKSFFLFIRGFEREKKRDYNVTRMVCAVLYCHAKYFELKIIHCIYFTKVVFARLKSKYVYLFPLLKLEHCHELILLWSMCEHIFCYIVKVRQQLFCFTHPSPYIAAVYICSSHHMLL